MEMNFGDADLRRHELGLFLKRKRASTIADRNTAGATGRRRTTGLRREDVASLAGVGLTWYTWLEQGREINVSTAFLEQICKALKLNSAERAYLFAMAHRRPPPIQGDGQKCPDIVALQTVLDCIGRPAYARNNRFDVLAWNDMNTRYFGDFGRVPVGERNVLWLMFTQTKYRDVMPEWENDARKLVANLRLRLAEANDRLAFEVLITRLYKESLDFQRIWNQHEVESIGEGVSRLISPKLGSVVFKHFTMAPEGFGDTHVVVFVGEENCCSNGTSAELCALENSLGKDVLRRPPC
jgi:transcriptional regulator with XRE-family HTH domain